MKISYEQDQLLKSMRKSGNELKRISLHGEEMHISGRNGDIRILIYRPQTKNKNLPVFFNFHGGGFVLGLPEEDDVFCKNVSDKLGIAVINVEYRLAPEFPFPAGINDAYDAVRYVHNNADMFGIDPDCMAVGGHSAGANISTVLCMMAKKYGEFSFRCQILDYPPLDINKNPVEKRNPEGAIPPEIASLFNACYCTTEESTDIYVSPVLSSIEELKGLPPALVITADMDSLRDEAKEYAQNLTKAGVPVIYHNFENVTHGFTIQAFSPLSFDEDKDRLNTPLLEEINRSGYKALDEIVDTLQHCLAKTTVEGDNA